MAEKGALTWSKIKIQSTNSNNIICELNIFSRSSNLFVRITSSVLDDIEYCKYM